MLERWFCGDWGGARDAMGFVRGGFVEVGGRSVTQWALRAGISTHTAASARFRDVLRMNKCDFEAKNTILKQNNVFLKRKM